MGEEKPVKKKETGRQIEEYRGYQKTESFDNIQISETNVKTAAALFRLTRAALKGFRFNLESKGGAGLHARLSNPSISITVGGECVCVCVCMCV